MSIVFLECVSCCLTTPETIVRLYILLFCVLWGKFIHDMLHAIFPIPEKGESGDMDTEKQPQEEEEMDATKPSKSNGSELTRPDSPSENTEKQTENPEPVDGLKPKEALEKTCVLSELKLHFLRHDYELARERLRSYRQELGRTNRALTEAKQELEDSAAMRIELENQIQELKDIAIKALEEKASNDVPVYENPDALEESYSKPVAVPLEDTAETKQPDSPTILVDSSTQTDHHHDSVVAVVNKSCQTDEPDDPSVVLVDSSAQTDQHDDSVAVLVDTSCQTDEPDNPTDVVVNATESSITTELNEQERHDFTTKIKELEEERDSSRTSLQREKNKLESIDGMCMMALRLTTSEGKKNLATGEMGVVEAWAEKQLKQKLKARLQPEEKHKSTEPEKNNNAENLEEKIVPSETEERENVLLPVTQYVRVAINTIPVDMAIDTHSQFSCVNRSFWEKIGEPALLPISFDVWDGNQNERRGLTDVLRGKNIKYKLSWKDVLGYFMANIKVDHEEYIRPLLVFDRQDVPNFIGRSWFKTLKLDKINAFQIQGPESFSEKEKLKTRKSSTTSQKEASPTSQIESSPTSQKEPGSNDQPLGTDETKRTASERTSRFFTKIRSFTVSRSIRKRKNENPAI